MYKFIWSISFFSQVLISEQEVTRAARMTGSRKTGNKFFNFMPAYFI
jgi:hypothetical protein